jgi:hypothetical protein
MCSLLAGVELSPQVVLLDKRVSCLPRSTIRCRAGRHESDYAELRKLGESLQLHRLQEVQKRSAHLFDAPVRIRHVLVFDPKTGRTSGPNAVVFYRGRITTVEPESAALTAPDEVEIDGDGGTVVAGLHDMHTTATRSGVAYLGAGVTTVRDMGENAVLSELSRRIDAGDPPGRTSYSSDSSRAAAPTPHAWA